jgi:hypothetical protein
MITVDSIEPEKLKLLRAEIEALDALPLSLEVLEKMVKLIADRFSLSVSATYRDYAYNDRATGDTTLTRYLDFKFGPQMQIMNVRLESNQYHCFHQCMADRYDRIAKSTSTAAWYYLIGLAYPKLWPRPEPRRSDRQPSPGPRMPTWKRVGWCLLGIMFVAMNLGNFVHFARTGVLWVQFRSGGHYETFSHSPGNFVWGIVIAALSFLLGLLMIWMAWDGRDLRRLRQRSACGEHAG